MPIRNRKYVGHVGQPTALLIGAGFSYWAARLPTASQLFDLKVIARAPREKRKLDSVSRLILDWRKSKRGFIAEEFIEHILDTKPRYRGSLLWYITRRLSDPFIATVLGGTQALMIDDRRARSIAGVKRAHEFLDRVKAVPLSGIVTTNYDLLLEYALPTRGFNYGMKGEILYGRGKNPGFPWQGAWPMLLGDIPLAKVHGSISWDSTTRYTDGRCGVKGNALIVPPKRGKTTLKELVSIWALAASILSKASRVLVFGFAFNPYDEALLDLLRKHGSQIGKVLLIDIDPRIAEAQAIWPKATVTACQPTHAGLRALPEWLDDLSYSDAF